MSLRGYDIWKTSAPEYGYGRCLRCHDSEEDHSEVEGIGLVCPKFIDRAEGIVDLLPFQDELEFEADDNGALWYLAQDIWQEIDEGGLYDEDEGPDD